MMKPRPLRDWLACTIPPEEGQEAVSKGGIVLPPNTVNSNVPWEGYVAYAGPGAKTDDQSDDVPMQCKIGDRIAFSRFVALETVIGGIRYRLVRDRDVITVVEPAVLPGQVVIDTAEVAVDMTKPILDAYPEARGVNPEDN